MRALAAKAGGSMAWHGMAAAAAYHQQKQHRSENGGISV